jgi:hypothetical protein
MLTKVCMYNLRHKTTIMKFSSKKMFNRLKFEPQIDQNNIYKFISYFNGTVFPVS